jgi:hypothetical protein
MFNKTQKNGAQKNGAQKNGAQKNGSKTGIKGRGAYLRGWSKEQPRYKQRTVMMKKCGKKCFLGLKKTFPICTKNTCKINRKGLHAAYVRAREYETITATKNRNTKKYRTIARKAYKMLYSTK